MSNKSERGANTKRGGRRTGLLRAGLFLVCVALGWSLWSQTRLQSRMASLEETASGEISDLRQAVSKIDPTGKAEPTGRVPLALVQRRMESVYLVTKGIKAGLEGPVATAWVIADGVLATNAHVAEEFDKTGKMQLFVRNRESAKTPNRVIKVKLHAGYEKFVEAVEDYRPYQVTPDGTPYGLSTLQGYDVALLFVERPEDLARPIPVASKAELEGLTPGDPLVEIGFPLSGVYNFDLQQVNPNPGVQHGHITAMSHFLQGRVPVEHAHMVIHNIASTGGNSGSPMLNVNGEVVSIESHNLGYHGESGAQRADLAMELLQGKDLSNVRTVHKPQWDKLLGNFRSGHDVIPWAVAQSLEKDLGEVKFTQETDRFRYNVRQQKAMSFCFEGEEPEHVIGRILDGRNNGPRIQSLVPDTVTPGVNGFAAKKCQEQPVKHRGIWHSKTFEIKEPGPYLLYAYDYSIEGPCSVVTFVGKPAGAATIQFFSTPDIGHSYAVAGVPKEVKSLEMHYLVDLQSRSQRCVKRQGQGVIDIGLVRFEKTQDKTNTGPLAGILGAASTRWSAMRAHIQDVRQKWTAGG